MNRHLSRTIAMQTVYEWDFRATENNAPASQDLEDITERNITAYEEDVDAEFVRSVVSGVVKYVDEIDELIVKFAPEWPIDQIALIDKTILRVAVFEILHREDVPPKVIINEAVELGKTFGSESTSRFVNGVLGTIYRQSARYNPADDLPKDVSEHENKDKEEKQNESKN